MRDKYVIIFLLFVSLMITSCHDNNIKDIGEEFLIRDTVITQFSDSSYFSDIRSMQIDNNRIYLTDYHRNQVIILNEKGQFAKSIGDEGRGPGELLGAADLFVDNDTIYVFNDSGRSFELYGLSYGHIKKINFPVNSSFRSTQRFTVKNGRIYISSPSHNTSIAALGINSDTYNVFGRIIEFDSDIKTRVQNSRHLVVKDSIIYAISRTLPIIEKYNLDGKLISIYDFSSVKYVQKRLDFVTAQVSPPNVSHILVSDIYLYEDKLYLLIVSNDSEKSNSNKVLVMDLSTNKIIPEKIYNLGEDRYGSIAANKNSLWAFSNKQGIIKFSI